MKTVKDIFWNFIQIVSIMRRHAEHNNHNSCLYSLEVIPLLTLVNSSYVFLTPLEMQAQYFMYFTLLTFLVFTPFLYQNLTFYTKLYHSNRGETSVFTQKTNSSSFLFWCVLFCVPCHYILFCSTLVQSNLFLFTWKSDVLMQQSAFDELFKHLSNFW